MPISYPEILDLKTERVPFAWTDREPMLYALGIGMGRDPMDEDELRFVTEKDPKIVPTFATIIAKEGLPNPTELNRTLVLDGERELIFHSNLGDVTSVLMEGRIVSVADKGEKGAIIEREVMMRNTVTGDPVCTMRSLLFARGDGGFGGPAETRGAPPPRPDRAPDRTETFATRPDQALLYRLSGDRNPLHSDPAFASRAGFDRPILHGLCTFGISCRAVLQTYADWDPTAIRRFSARFSAPCVPGETLSVDLWEVGRILHFEARVASRGTVIVKNGIAELA